MRSSVAEIAERRERLASVLRREGYLSVGELTARFSVSEATVRRDLSALASENRITRTYGGALWEFDALFMPFYQRNMQNREAKRRIAAAACPMVRPGDSIFLDAGSTVFAVAEELAGSRLDSLRVVTNSLPVAEVLASVEFSEIHLLGGCLLPHQLVVVGPGTSLSLSGWQFDLALLSAEGMNQVGLWNSEDAITDFQRHVCGRSRSVVFCLDGSKLGREAPSLLLPWPAVVEVVTDLPPKSVEKLGPEAAQVNWVLV